MINSMHAACAHLCSITHRILIGYQHGRARTAAGSARVEDFAVGEKFASYEELKTKIKAYENSRSIRLCHCDSRTLEAAKKSGAESKEGFGVLPR